MKTLLKTIILFALTLSGMMAQNQLAGSLTLNNTAGAGFLQIANQSVAPSTPTAAGRIYFDASNRISFVGTTGLGVSAVNLNSITSAAVTDLTLTGGSGVIATNSKFVLGGGAPNASDPLFAIDRTISGTGDGRSFLDETIVTRTGGASFASYDSEVTLSANADMGHYVGFQVASTLNLQGGHTIANLYGAFVGFHQTAGSATNTYGYVFATPTGSNFGTKIAFSNLDSGASEDFAGDLIVRSSTASSSRTTGSIVASGGLGAAGDMNVGGGGNTTINAQDVTISHASQRVYLDITSPATNKDAAVHLQDGTNGWYVGLMGGSTTTDGAYRFFSIGGGNLLTIAPASGVTTFASTTSGISTTAAAILGKSMGLTENLFVGGNISVNSGANTAAGTVTLVAGTATITSTAITANSVIMFSEKTAGGTPGLYQPLAAVSTGSATVTSAATETSTYNWVALKVN